MISGYISGTFDTFDSRLHQCVSGAANLEQFRIEGQQYTGLSYISKNTKNHWKREFIQKANTLDIITGNVFP